MTIGPEVTILGWDCGAAFPLGKSADGIALFVGVEARQQTN
jgi:hypothetical protein